MKSLLAAVLACLALLTPARAWEAHWQARDAIIPLVVNQLGKQKTVLYGDSNSEAFWWAVVEGCWITNAGYGGARIRTLAQRAQIVANMTTPRTVHVMIGTNNLGVPRSDPEWSTLQADMQQIIAAFKAVGSKVVVWPIPPVAPPQNFPAQNRTDINNAILAAVQATGAYYDWWWPQQITDSNGLAISGAMTSDGIHLSPSSQASRYYRIEMWRQHIKTNTGMDCQ